MACILDRLLALFGNANSLFDSSSRPSLLSFAILAPAQLTPR
jgi:hypothetical protein